MNFLRIFFAAYLVISASSVPVPIFFYWRSKVGPGSSRSSSSSIGAIRRLTVKDFFHNHDSAKQGKRVKNILKGLGWVAAAPVAIAGIGSAVGAVEGAVASTALPDDSRAKKEVVAAGAVKGAVHGLFLLPNLANAGFLSIPDEVVANRMAARIMKHENPSEVTRAAIATGSIRNGFLGLANVPVLHAVSGTATAATTAKILGTDVGTAAKYGMFSRSGELVALAQSSDKSKAPIAPAAAPPA